MRVSERRSKENETSLRAHDERTDGRMAGRTVACLTRETRERRKPLEKKLDPDRRNEDGEDERKKRKDC